MLDILIVEDEPTHLQLFRRSVTRLGLDGEVMQSDNGKDAIEIIRDYCSTHSASQLLVFLDLNIPIMNGIQMLERLRSDSTTKDVKVIMLSTSDEENEMKQCKSLGCLDYMVKPVGYKQIGEVLERISA